MTTNQMPKRVKGQITYGATAPDGTTFYRQSGTMVYAYAVLVGPGGGDQHGRGQDSWGTWGWSQSRGGAEKMADAASKAYAHEAAPVQIAKALAVRDGNGQAAPFAQAELELDATLDARRAELDADDLARTDEALAILAEQVLRAQHSLAAAVAGRDSYIAIAIAAGVPQARLAQLAGVSKQRMSQIAAAAR